VQRYFRAIPKTSGKSRLSQSTSTLEKHFRLCNGTNIVCQMFNECFRYISVPALVTISSQIFSISSAVVIIMKGKVFDTFNTFLAPVFMFESALVNILAPSLTSWVFTMSTAIHDANSKNLALRLNSQWMRKKQKALRVNKIHISDCYFDKSMTFTNNETSIDNAISIVLSVKTSA